MGARGGVGSQWPRLLFGLLAAALAVEVVRDGLKKLGDFVGYADTGARVLAGADVYGDILLNTWPPFFSLVCVPLALGDAASPRGVRLVWLAASALLWLASARWFAGTLYGRRLALYTPALLLPLLFDLRLALENLASVQINMVLLALCVGAIALWLRGRDALAGLSLGFAVSVKVFPVFLLAYFLVRGHWRVGAWTLATCLVAALLPLVAFGPATALEYYAVWTAKAFGEVPGLSYPNQSALALAGRLLSPIDASHATLKLGADYRANLLSLPLATVVRAYYLTVVAVGLLYVWLTRTRPTRRITPGVGLDLGLALGACALLTPIVWKSYGVFWLPLLLALYPYLYSAPAAETPYIRDAGLRRRLRWGYHAGWGLMTLSSELFLGSRFSDVAEVYGAMTVGGLALVGLAVYVRVGVTAPA